MRTLVRWLKVHSTTIIIVLSALMLTVGIVVDILAWLKVVAAGATGGASFKYGSANIRRSWKSFDSYSK